MVNLGQEGSACCFGFLGRGGRRPSTWLHQSPPRCSIPRLLSEELKYNRNRGSHRYLGGKTLDNDSQDHPVPTLAPSSNMPHSRLSRLPQWVSRWLGYREKPPKEPSHVVYLWSFIGAFCGLSILQAIFGQVQYFIDRKVPPILASYVSPFQSRSSVESSLM